MAALGLGMRRVIRRGSGSSSPEPLFVSAITSTDGLSVDVLFDIDMDDPTGKHAQFALSDRTITAAALKGGNVKVIVLTVSVAYTESDIIAVGYTRGTVVSAEGVALETFAGELVTNAVIYEITNDPDLELHYSSRSGNQLLETGSGSSRNAKILTRVAEFKDSKWLNFRATYNPSPEVVTIYFALKRGGTTSGTATPFSTAATSDPYGLFCDIQKSTGKLGTYTNTTVLSSTHFAPVGEWVQVMYRWTLGNGGKLEIATNGSAFETLIASYNFQTSLIQGNGVISVGAYQGTGGTGQNFFTGEMSEVKIWESSKGWDDIYGDCDMWIPLAGNGSYEFAMNSTYKLAALWATAAYRYQYSEYGSRYWMDGGFEVWEKDSFSDPLTIYAPKGCSQTAMLANDWLQKKVYDGSLTKFNYFDAYIDFDPTGSEHADLDIFDRDNTTIFNAYARHDYTLESIDHSYYTGKPYWWHSQDINRHKIRNYCKAGYQNRIFPYADDNSMGFDSRNVLNSLFVISQADATKLNIVETFTGDKMIVGGVSFVIDDLYYVPTRLANVLQVISTFFQKYFIRFSYYTDVHAQTDLSDNQSDLQSLLDKGIELCNHSKNHIAWKDYLETHTDQEYYDAEVAPVQTSYTNVFSFAPLSFAYPRQEGTDAGVNALMLAAGIIAIRHSNSEPDFNGSGAPISFAQYVAGSKSNIIPSWTVYNTLESAIMGELEAARDDGTIFSICLHAITTNDEGTNISYARMKKIIEYCLANNMPLYLSKELPAI